MKRLVVTAAVAISALALSVSAGRALSSSTTTPQAPQRPAPVGEPDTGGDDPVQAALSVVRLLGSSDMYDGRARSTVLRKVLSEDLLTMAEDGFARAATTLELRADGTSEQGELVARLVPVGHHVVERGTDRAVVAVWTMGLLGVAGPTSSQPVLSTWSTETLVLERRQGRWVCTDLQHEDGPAPVGGAQVPAPPSELLEHDRLFAESA